MEYPDEFLEKVSERKKALGIGGILGIEIEYAMGWAFSERRKYEKALASQNKSKRRSGTPVGFKFKRVTCPECGRAIKENWIIRHLKSGCKVGGSG
jgi:hypothetical protein